MSEQSEFDGETWASPTLPVSGRGGGPADPVELAAGETFARYKVEHLIGSGGMGLVYAARDVELDRRVAVKVVRPDATGAGSSSASSLVWRERLLREARALAQISHPNVVIVHDVGELDGRVFIAMELIDGVSLKPWWRGESHWRHKLRVLLGAARGLAAAHKAGVIHRDLKPANIIVTDKGVAKVLDFGLSRLADDNRSRRRSPDDLAATPLSIEEADSDQLTEVGTIMGTPAYMSPEQLLGNVIDARADQFSFGAVLYQAFTNKLPFPGRSVAAIYADITAQNVAPLPLNLPRWLSRIVLRMLRADPAERYSDMSEVISALESGARRRRRATQAAVAGLTGIVGVAMAVAISQRGATPSCERAGDATSVFWNAEQKEKLAASFGATELAYVAPILSLTEAALGDFAGRWRIARVEACRDTHERGDQSAELLDKRITCLERRRRSFAALTERLTGSLNEKLVNESTRAVLALPAVADCADREALSSHQPLPLDPTARKEIDRLRAEADRLGADRLLPLDHKPLLERARALAEAAELIEYPPVAAEVYQQLAELENVTGDIDAAEEHYYRALWEAVAGHSDRLAAQMWTDLYYLIGDKRERFDESERIRGHVAAALARIGDPPELVAEFLNTQGSVLIRAAKYEEAVKRYEAAVEKMTEVNGADGYQLAIPLSNLGNAYRNLKRFDDAQRTNQRALEIKERHLGPDHPSIAATLNNMGITLAQSGDEDAAIPLLVRAQKIKAATVGTATRSFGIGEANLAMMLADKARFKEALPRFRQATRSFEAELGKAAVMIGYSLTGEGQCLIELGDPSAALPPLERALELRTTPKRSPEAATTEMWLARALWENGGDRVRAHKLAKRSARTYATDPDNPEGDLVRAWLKAHPL